MKTSKFKKQFRDYARSHASKIKILPLEKHALHQIEIRPGIGKHAAQYWCIDCKKWVSWLSKKDTQTAKQLGLL